MWISCIEWRKWRWFSFFGLRFNWISQYIFWDFTRICSRKKPLSIMSKLHFLEVGWNQLKMKNRNLPRVNMLLTFCLLLWVPKLWCYPKLRPTACGIMLPFSSPPDDNMHNHKNIRWYLSSSFHSICYCWFSCLVRISATKWTKEKKTKKYQTIDCA